MINRKKFVLTGFIAILFLLGLYYANRPYSIEFYDHPEKVWAHRVNDLDKLKNSLPEYAGIELDVVYNSEKNELDIFHPPKSSSQLYLSTFLEEIPENETPFLWLDLKNLSKNNSDVILLKLTQDLDRAKYPAHKILVESSYAEGLALFTQNGFLCSYLINEDLSINTKESILQIRKVLEKQPNTGVSSFYQNHPYLKSAFPNRSKYFWMIDSFLSHGFGQSRTLINDPTIRAVLVRI